MSYAQTIVNEYLDKHPINIAQIKQNYKNKNRIKLIDETTTDAYTIGVDLAKLYVEKLMIK